MSIRSVGTIVVSIAVFVLVGAWSIAVWVNLGSVPEYNADGSVRIDEFARAKDVLVLVLPLATVAVGYWLGSEGKAQADQKAQSAETASEAAKQETLDVRAQNAALSQAAREQDPGILDRARQIYGGEL